MKEIYKNRVRGKGKDRSYLPTYLKLFSFDDNTLKACFECIEKYGDRNDLYNYNKTYPIANPSGVPIVTQINKNIQVIALQNYDEIGVPYLDSSYKKWICCSQVEIISKFLKQKFKNIWRCRITGIPSSDGLPWHIDTNTSVACRVYIPLSSNIDEKNLFEIKRRQMTYQLKMKIGEGYFVNTAFKHRVLNNTRDKRYSLIFNTTSEDIERVCNLKFINLIE